MPRANRLLSAISLVLKQEKLLAQTTTGSYPAPAFPLGLDWIHTSGKPLTIGELKGKLVLLDFWTYG